MMTEINTAPTATLPKAEEKPAVHKVTLRRRSTTKGEEEQSKTAGGAGSRVCKILNEWK